MLPMIPFCTPNTLTICYVYKIVTFLLQPNNTAEADVAPWFYEWIGWDRVGFGIISGQDEVESTIRC